MKDLIILGTGVHSLEMVEIVARVNGVAPTWNVLGFIASEKAAGQVGRQLVGLPVLGTAARIADYPDACFVPGNEYRESFPFAAERLVSLIDPSTFVSPAARIGRGCVLYPHCFIGHNAVLGDLVFALAGCVINHDAVLEDKVVLASAVTLAGGVHVESDCYLGQSCTIRQHLRIGRGSLIGMGAVVVKDVPPNSVMIGNPAGKLRDRKVVV
jgi:sugar O-acyltransferase (sialic acid O-acetyltransferase NeuD family)